MGYKVSWVLENRIMLISYEGVLSKADLKNYLLETMDMRDRANTALGEGGPLVHTITDARRLTKNEISLKEAIKMIDILRKQRVGWSIYIASNKLDMFFATVGHQLAGVRYRTVASVTEGVNFLKETDDTLANFTYSGEKAPT
jgi:hypothetical protein